MAQTQNFASYDLNLARSTSRSAATVYGLIKRFMSYAKHTFEGRSYVYLTLKKISQLTGLSISTVQRSIKLLIDKKLIAKTRLWAKRWNSTNFFTLLIEPAAPIQASDPESAEVVKVANNKQSDSNNTRTKRSGFRAPDFGQLARKAAQKVAATGGRSQAAGENYPAAPKGFARHSSGRLVVAGEWPASIG